jgi:cytochrome c oxidase assembly protein subunit 11
MTDESKSRGVASRRLARTLALVAVTMFGFGYAMVPLYNAFCELTGLNGRTGERIAAETVERMPQDVTREVTVEFVTAVNAGFPWEFRPAISQISVHPGVETEVMFEASNRGSAAITGQAVPSVTPTESTRFFSKTECFCFTQQTLTAGETKQMPVRFVVNPKLPKHIQTITLGYTFFRAEQQAAVSPRGNEPNT